MQGLFHGWISTKCFNGPTGDENGLFTAFAKFLKICSVIFLFRAYNFLRMSSISHEELNPIELLEGGSPGLDSDSKKQQFSHLFAKILKICSITYFCFTHTTSLGCRSGHHWITQRGYIPGLDWDPPSAKNAYFHTVCPLSLNLLCSLHGSASSIYQPPTVRRLEMSEELPLPFSIASLIL